VKTTRIDAPLLILGVGFAFSLAANLLWTWEGGPVRILGGALASLALPGSIHLWPQIPATTRTTRVIRAGTMTAIAAMAAYTTFSHASALLVAHGEEPLLAMLYPVMTELLVVMGVLARKTPVKATPVLRRAREARPVPPPTDPVEPAPAPEAPPPVQAKPEEWARKNWPVTGRQIEEATGVTKSYAYKLHRKIRAETQQVAAELETVP
jgi:hypothetical protein